MSSTANAHPDRAIDLDGGLPEGEAKAVAVRKMFDTISPRYDMVNRIMTLRLDVRWRRQTADALALPAGSRILDLAAGTGDFCRQRNSLLDGQLLQQYRQHFADFRIV